MAAFGFPEKRAVPGPKGMYCIAHSSGTPAARAPSLEQPMHLAIDATVVRPPLTGVHYAVRHEALALADALPAGAACYLATDEPIRAAADRHGHRAPPLPAALRHVWRRVLWQQTRLPALLRREQCDALLALAYTAPLRCPVPLVVQAHDLIALQHPELCRRRNAWHLRALMPSTLRQAHTVLVSAEPVRQALLHLTGKAPDRVVTVPLGVDPLFLAEPPAAEVAEPYLLVVGTLEPKKGVDVLLAAFQQVMARRRVQLVLAGQAGWRCRDLLRQVDALTATGRLRWLGYVPRAQLPALYHGAIATVVPSRVEGFGLPILEAMACGSPVVHSDHPVVVATAGGHGTAFRSGDAADLARVLDRLLADPATVAAQRDAGRAWARRHTWQAWAGRVHELLAAVTAPR
jgi:glycosyltransferase involved in cell wall biosynthesis